MSQLVGIYAIAALSIREAVGQRLWLPFAAGAGLLMAIGLRLGAVDDSAKLKLAVVGITAVIGFVTVLLSILVAAGQVRRDLDARVAYLLFAKPLSRWAYVVGRWLGVMGILTAGMLALAVVGTLVMSTVFPALPQMRDVHKVVAWEEVSPLGEPITITDDSSRRMLSGQPGGGIRWTIAGLPTEGPQDGLELLVRVQVRGVGDQMALEESLVSVTAAPGKGGQRLLSLDPASPYGFGTDGAKPGPGQVVLRHRDSSRNDMVQDFARLRLTPDVIAPDGTTIIQITRLDSRSTLVLTRNATVLVARPGGGFLLNLVRGGLVLMASAGLLAAGTLLVATVSNIGVTLLAGLTMFFAGNALWTIQDTLAYEKLSAPVARLLQLAQVLLPDFDRFSVAANLAASQSIPWTAVGAAWMYFGLYAVVFLVLAWFSLARKEL